MRRPKPSPLMADTLQLLDTRVESLKAIAQGASGPPWDPGLKITLSYVRKLHERRLHQPGTQHLEAIHYYLSRHRSY